MNIIFLGGKDIGLECLKILHKKSIHRNDVIVGVLCSNREGILKQKDTLNSYCNNNQIPVIENLSDAEFLDFDVLVSVQYHEILNQKLLHKAKKLAVNLHMGPLPEYRGCNQFSFAIIDKAKTFGTTLHLMSEEIDGGDILFENRFEIPKNIDVMGLYKLTYHASIQMFEEKIDALLNFEFSPTQQSHLTSERGTSIHYRREIEQIKKIDLTWDKEKIIRHFRATYFPPFPPPIGIKNGIEFPLNPERLALEIDG